MSFNADIVVMAPDVPDVTLVAEVKKSLSNLGTSEIQLKKYMLGRKCSLALLVTPEMTRIYRDTFRDFSLDSITLVGEFPTADLLDLAQAPQDERALRDAVQLWLEHLAASWPSALPKSQAVRAPVVEFLVPGVVEGRVSSGGLG